ncbi:MAG: hypothetical protein OEO23_16690 [Gemmatimonadota bacterium]|nr:hypothetical protein [Gemmatimonadota bacterium]
MGIRGQGCGVLVILALWVLVGVGRPNPVAAQAFSRADSAAVLLETARFFEDEGRAEVAEALYQLLRDRYGATPAGALARVRLESTAGNRLDRSGRVELQVWGTTYGLWLGVAVPTALGAESSEAFGVGILSGGFVGLLAARAATRSRDLTEGQTRAITWGGTWGTWQGLGWALALDLGQQEICTPDGFCYNNGDDTEEVFGSMVLGGLAGLATGAIIARNPVGLGVASGAHYGSLWGTWIGATSSVLFNLDGDDGWTTTLLAGNAGLVGGALASRALDMSRNRVRLVSLGGLLGGLAGAGVMLIIDPSDAEDYIALPLGASLAGLGIALHATRDYDRRGRPRAEGPGGTALLNLHGDAWSVDPPLPVPVIREGRSDSGHVERRLGVSFNILRVSF